MVLFQEELDRATAEGPGALQQLMVPVYRHIGLPPVAAALFGDSRPRHNVAPAAATIKPVNVPARTRHDHGGAHTATSTPHGAEVQWATKLLATVAQPYVAQRAEWR